MIIAIDGPSGTGKSTVAQKTAHVLGFLYFDTGAMYRAFAYFMHKNHFAFENPLAVQEALKLFDFDLIKRQGEYVYLVGEEDVSSIIRQETISNLASQIAKNPIVRKELLPIQRAFAKKGNFVMEGRDIGTEVFPEAEVKVFLTAKKEIRAQRRLDQLKRKFPLVEHHYHQILEEIEQRDTNDSNRATCPLRQAPDALLIDTSNLSVDEVVQKIVELARLHKK